MIDVRGDDGQPMGLAHATVPVGRSLYVAPAFTATGTAEDIAVESTIVASYSATAGRYRVTATAHRSVSPSTEITPIVLRQVRLGELMTAAVPHCVAVKDDALGSGTVHDLLGSGQRLIPSWMADAVAKAGPTADSLDVVQLVYGVAALAGQPPMKAVASELRLAPRTATHWIGKARKAGLLHGLTYSAGRQPSDH